MSLADQAALRELRSQYFGLLRVKGSSPEKRRLCAEVRMQIWELKNNRSR